MKAATASVLLLALLCASSVCAVKPATKRNGHPSIRVTSVPSSTKSVSLHKAPLKDDLCPFCVSAMGQIMNQLINILLNVGVVGSCGSLCGELPNQIEAVACDLLCDYVGIDAFIDALQYEDPDPIFVCQLIDICPVVNNGSATMVSPLAVSPRSGQQGQTFTIQLDWTVIKPTGPGGINVVIIPPVGFPLSGGTFIEGQAPGRYQAEFKVQTQPQEMDPFNPGKYQVQAALCEGDCTTDHKWGGVYAQAQGEFTLTQ